VLGDPIVTKKLTHMLTICMEEGEIDATISTPLPKRYVCHVSRRKCTGREFKMTTELGSYEMDGVMLDLGSNVNIFPKKSWELMGKPKLVWSPFNSGFPTNTNLSHWQAGASGSEHRWGKN
jgi:hypothetical protein